MTIKDEIPKFDPAKLTKKQFAELAAMLSTASLARTVRDNDFAQHLTELANMMHPEPGEALLKQTHIWISAISDLLSEQAAEVHRILGVPDQGDEPGETLQ